MVISFVLPVRPFKVSHASDTEEGDQLPVANDLKSLGENPQEGWMTGHGPASLKNTGAPSLLPS